MSRCGCRGKGKRGKLGKLGKIGAEGIRNAIVFMMLAYAELRGFFGVTVEFLGEGLA